jgi:hypothetical protein
MPREIMLGSFEGVGIVAEEEREGKEGVLF